MQSCYIALLIYTSLLCIQVYDCAPCLEWCRASQLKGKVDRSIRSRCWAQTWGLHLNTVFELLIPIKIAFIIYDHTKSWNILSKCKLSKVHALWSVVYNMQTRQNQFLQRSGPMWQSEIQVIGDKCWCQLKSSTDRLQGTVYRIKIPKPNPNQK